MSLIIDTYKQLQNVSSCNLMCNTWKGKNSLIVHLNYNVMQCFIFILFLITEVRNKSVQVYVALTGVFTASTILLLVVLVLVITFLFIQYRKGMILGNIMLYFSLYTLYNL